MKVRLSLRVKHLCLAWVGAAMVAGPPAAAQIRRVLDFREDGSSGGWSAGGAIVFQRGGEIWVAGRVPAADLCITCGNSGLPAGRNGGPEWFPGGERFLFGSGQRVLTGDGLRRIAAVPGIEGGAGDFRFSRDGKQLAWTLHGSAGTRAAFAATVSAGTVGGAHRVELPPELVFEAVDDFLPGARELLVTASRRGEDPRLTEIYACSLSGRAKCRAVTHNPGGRDDDARATPSGKRLLFASTGGGGLAPGSIDFKSDYWLEELDAPGGAKRMTWFNEPANPNYVEQGARAATASWGPDGKWLLATLVLDAWKGRTRLVKIEFPEAE